MDALKPSVPHPGLLPVRMSVRPSTPFEYKKGLRKPSDERLDATRTSLSRLMTAAKVGAAAEVPLTRPFRPPLTMEKFIDCAETSGYACRVAIQYTYREHTTDKK